MRKRLFISYLLLLLLFNLGQNIVFGRQNTIGLQQVINYNNQQFHGGMQTWNICQDKNGILYFANNAGLLTYNGKFWKIYPVPNKTILRSIALDTSDRIYAGAQDEMGYFFPAQSGELVYHSLKSLIPSTERQFADIW